jgi:ectoine hydroxylase-related dioxygenase (phytanoyl-CoA dioxygenase family)
MHEELSTPYPLTAEQIAQYQRDGYIKLKDVLSAEVLAEYGPAVEQMVHRLNRQTLPLHERNTYGKAFLQIANLWETSEKVKEFAFSPRLARIATELMGVTGVRMYHDQALFKEPGGGFTPWHADQFYWPLSNEHSVTAWIPFQPVPVEMGPLAFCIGSQHLLTGRNLSISDDSEAQIGRTLKDYPKDESPYELGEVSFHAGWLFHRAGPNQTQEMRRVFTIIYMDEQMRVAPPANANQEKDWERWLPGAQVGQLIDTPLNPVLYSRMTG